MTSSAFKRQLIHTAVVQRASTAQNNYGEPIATWSNAGTVTCRFVAKEEKVAAEGIGFMMVDSYLLLAEADADIETADRIADVLDGDGGTVDAGPFGVERVLMRRGTGNHHLSVRLERVD